MAHLSITRCENLAGWLFPKLFMAVVAYIYIKVFKFIRKPIEMYSSVFLVFTQSEEKMTL